MQGVNSQQNSEPHKISLFRSEKGVYKQVYSSALPEGETLKIIFKIDRSCGAFNFTLNLVDDKSGINTPQSCPWLTLENGFDIYETTLSFDKEGLYFLYGSYLTGNGNTVLFNFGDFGEPLPITVYKKDFSTPKKFKGGTMYQIFVDRFAKSDTHFPKAKDYARINEDWENGIPDYAQKPGDALDNSMFFGGNLYGVSEKLDYLSSLGVNILYLCPIFDARTNHKYDTSDYTKVDSMFGGDEALDNLIKECKARGIKIILDGVFNHVGDDSIYFNKYGRFLSVGAYQSTESEYYPWFEFSEYPNKYNCWWGIDILPSIKKNSADFCNFINGDSGIIRRYLKKGIDGWRLDVADELSDNFLCSLRSAAKAENKNALIIGEVWEDAAVKIAYSSRRKYFRGEQLDGVMNYPLRLAMIDYVISGNAEKLANTAKTLYLHYPEAVSHVQMNILGTHDTERILSILACDGIQNLSNPELAHYKMNSDSRTYAKANLMLASFLQFTLPGIPCIYYGDEAGMEGGRDPFNRLPYPWGREDNSLICHYELLGKLRKKCKDLAEGEFEVIYAKDGLFIYRRGELTCAVNKGEDTSLIFDTPVKDALYGRKSFECEGLHEFPLVKNDFCVLKAK